MLLRIAAQSGAFAAESGRWRSQRRWGVKSHRGTCEPPRDGAGNIGNQGYKHVGIERNIRRAENRLAQMRSVDATAILIDEKRDLSGQDATEPRAGN